MAHNAITCISNNTGSLPYDFTVVAIMFILILQAQMLLAYPLDLVISVLTKKHLYYYFHYFNVIGLLCDPMFSILCVLFF